MTKKKTPPRTPSETQPVSAPAPIENKVEETPYEAVAGICSVLVVGLFILTFLVQNFVIPSGSMEKTLLVGDHLVVDRITLAPPAKWMPLVRYREPKRGDIVVFLKPVPDLVNGEPVYQFLVKRLVGVPGDRIHLRDGIVILNGVAQDQPYAAKTTLENHYDFLDEFPSIPPTPDHGAVVLQPLSQAVGLHPHNRILTRVERCLRATKYLGCDAVFVQFLCLALKIALTDIREEPLQPRRTSQGCGHSIQFPALIFRCPGQGLLWIDLSAARQRRSPGELR